MIRGTCVFLASLGVVVATLAYAADDAKLAVKEAATPAPKELKEPIRKLLHSDKSIQLLDGQGNLFAELWLRKELPAKATPEQVKNGLTYRELDESVLLAAIKFEQLFTDYRKQKIKPGVYTLRLGFQPQDGDHMGTAPHGEFCLLLPAAADEKPDLLEVKDLREMSSKSPGGVHPGIMLLYPNDKPAAETKLLDKGMGTFALSFKEVVSAAGQKVPMGFALTVVGHTTAE